MARSMNRSTMRSLNLRDFARLPPSDGMEARIACTAGFGQECTRWARVSEGPSSPSRRWRGTSLTTGAGLEGHLHVLLGFPLRRAVGASHSPLRWRRCGSRSFLRSRLRRWGILACLALVVGGVRLHKPSRIRHLFVFPVVVFPQGCRVDAALMHALQFTLRADPRLGTGDLSSHTGAPIG